MQFFKPKFSYISVLVAASLAVGACSCEQEKKQLHQAASVPTEVLPESDALFFDALGETARPAVTVKDQIGEVMSDIDLRWSSSDEAVVTASADGLLTSVGNGEATVEIRAGDARARLAVTVRQRAAVVDVKPELLAFESVGALDRLEAIALDRNGHPVDGTDFRWSSGDEDVARVDSFGNVTAVGEGATEVVARVEGGEASGSAQVVVAPASTTLRFHFSHPHWIAGTPTEVQVEILDPAGHRIVGANQDLEIALGENPGGGTLGGTLIQRAANGLAVFPDLQIDKAGQGYTLIVGDGTLQGESEPFDVVAGAASRLRFVQQPADTIAGETLAAVQVQIEDAWGNRIPGATHPVELALVEAPEALEGTLRVAASDGVARFEDLRIERAASSYHLTASVEGWSGAKSEAFAIHPADPAGLVWLDEPKDAASGADIGPVRAAVVDAFGNTATGYEGKVSVALLPEDTEARLSGETEIGAAAGLANFGPLHVDLVGTYELALRAGAFGPHQSRPFTIHPGAPARLRFVRAPTGGVRGELLAAAEVEVQDQAGNRSDDDLSITLDLLGGPGAISGTLSKTTSQARATFADLRIDREGEGYRLQASAEGVEAAISSPFDVTACAAGRTDCGGTCVDLQNDDLHCGQCEKTCAWDQSCAFGSCTCDEPGLAVCDGACVDLESDPAHCGACETTCRFDEVCAGGGCACPPGTEDCDGVCVDTQTDPANCGTCGQSCGADRTCSSGACICAPPLSECGGACVDLSTDPLFCGSCDTSCDFGQHCAGGTCACDDPGLSVCAGACVDTQSDAANCGGCGNACDPGVACENGKCATVCPPGQEMCDGACRDLQRDPDFCGGCETACQTNDLCSSGRCMPDPEYANWPVPSEQPPNHAYTFPTGNTVLDTVTNLMWQREVPSDSMNWQAAADYCRNLGLDGYGDWRLPTRIELISITMLTNGMTPHRNPAINRVAFPNTPSERFWTASEFVGAANQRWAINFSTGGAGGWVPSTAYRVRCVRYGPNYPAAKDLPPRYTDFTNSGNYVLDNRTGLHWQNTTNWLQGPAVDADNWCRQQFYGGRRAYLPFRKELETLVDVRRRDPAYHTGMFHGPYPDDHWSRTLNDASGCDAFGCDFIAYWVVDFFEGANLAASGTQFRRFRCVAGPPPP